MKKYRLYNRKTGLSQVITLDELWEKSRTVWGSLNAGAIAYIGNTHTIRPDRDAKGSSL